MPAACRRRGRVADLLDARRPSPSRRECAAIRTRRPSTPCGSRRDASARAIARVDLVGAHQAAERHARALRRSSSRANASTQPGCRPNTSSTIEIWSGWIVALQPRELVDDVLRRCERRSAARRSASRTSCSGTGSRASWRRSSRGSRDDGARSRGSARRRPDPTREMADRRASRTNGRGAVRARPSRARRDTRCPPHRRAVRRRSIASTSSASVTSPSPRITAARAALEVRLRMIGGVGARDDAPGTRALARSRSSRSAAWRIRSRHIFDR